MHIPSGCSQLDNTIIIDKIKGLIFGALLGDSLGLATEGLSKAEVQQTYGQGPIRFGMDEDGIPFLKDEYRSQFEENDFGDDAEQILVLLETIFDNGGHFLSKEFSSKLLEYSKNENKDLPRLHNGMNATNKAVLAHPTYITSPQKAAVEVWKSRNNLRGASGALVRAPLLGIIKFWDGTTVIENTTECCRVTHPDPRCMISCVITSTLIARLLRGQDLEIENNMTPIPSPTSSKPSPYFTDSLRVDYKLRALVDNVVETNLPMLLLSQTDPLFKTPETDKDRMRSYHCQLKNHCGPGSLAGIDLGGEANDQDAFKCLSAAIYCLTREIPPQCETEYFKKILTDIVLQGGDADINATVVGAMMGARLGYSQLPTEWVVGMRRWEWLEDKLEEFCSFL